VRASAVVPTLGRSPLLVPALEALRREGAEIVVVDQGEAPAAIPAGLADRVLRPGRNLGFAAGTNLGIAAAAGEWIATVNDDALVEPGWLSILIAALAADPRAAAAQGINLLLDAPETADGCGIAWNRWWQAVQIGHGKPAPAATSGVREVFGISATAAVYRREALRAVAAGGEPFDAGLVSYYEDVDLAVRLRAAGFRALVVPEARARHAGSLTGRTLSRERWRLIYGNRWRVAARHLGGGFWPRVPLLALRDGIDLGRALLRADGALVTGIVAGWGRALRAR
jgi:GT2 family glycosyltransferase